MSGLYCVRVFAAKGGERIPAVLDGRGVPSFDATIFSISTLRAGSKSHSKVEQPLRGVQKILEFLDTKGIDLPSRIASGEFLSIREVDGLVRHLYAGSPGHPSPGPKTVATRIEGIVLFLRWMVDYHGHRLWRSLAERINGRAEAEAFLARLVARKPRRGGRTGKRLGLDRHQMEALVAALHAIADAADASGDADGIFVADRTLLWFDWALETGLRIGELLGLRLRDIDFEAGVFRIIRRPDAPDDPRADPARVKGEGRELQLSPYLSERTRAHVDDMRAGRPRAGSHDFVFVALDGSPLSRASVSKLFRGLRESHPILGEAFSSHVMRHTWNDGFSDDAEAAGLREADECAARATSMGWADPGSAAAYLGRRTRRRMADASRCRQERLMAVRGRSDA